MIQRTKIILNLSYDHFWKPKIIQKLKIEKVLKESL
jgi:hypothetical protein